MDAILPLKIKNEQKFFESALKVGYNEMEIIKFKYVLQQSDLDIFPKMHDERINILLYGWELCEDYKQKLNPNEWELPEEMEMILKHLVPWSMDIWFSKEWDKCRYLLKIALIHCLNRARDLLMRMPDMMQINWDFLLLYNLKPWDVLYLKNLTVTKEKTIENGAQSIETEELPATVDDISYVKLEQLPIIVLRLIKIFDQSSIDMVKTLCMRVITAWNQIHQTELETSGSRRPYIPPEDKRCLMLICHIYLMAVYESDDVKGYVIDNMINNIRFYYQGFQNSCYAVDNLEYTPARYIALTNFHLRIQKRDFFDFFIWNKYDTSLVNLFGVVSQAYKSYLLGNLLMELNNMNEDDFVANTPLYKRLMNSYVNEREKSELFLLNELDKIEAQRYAHNIIQTVKNVTDFKSKICKGNRMSNICNYENSDDTVAPLGDTKIEINFENKENEIKDDISVAGEEIEDEQERVRVKESELRLDPVFQYLPNNESMLYYVYDVLAKKDYTGWHFAKIVLLVKIIGLEQNMIETWRYHPGLTTDFMLNLELKLSDHYVDLAKIFKEHPFLEQEFWLTAFYLSPTTELYEVVKRLGMRNNRKRADEHVKLVLSVDNIEAKYGLLSSTIDVKELATMSNTEDPARDYDPLFSVLHSLRVPDSLVKDMITAIFLPRNRSFAWAVDWVILRNRCKMIMNSSKEKKRFVDLNMAEANERLKYLIIDYEKYKNRPQLDYGTIEEGYENLMTSGEFDKESEEEEEEEEDDFEDDEDLYESKRRGRRSTAATVQKKEEEKTEDDNSQEDDPFLMGKRRTRARTAATLASFLFQTLPRASRRKRNQKSLEEETKNDEEKIPPENDDKSSDSTTPLRTSQSPIPSPLPSDCEQYDTKIANIPTKILKERLKERPTFLNTTQGFQNLIDIWNVEKSDLQSIDENCVSLMESSTTLQIAVKLKLLNSEINPMGCDEKEYIDDKEMIIHNDEFVIKKEYDMKISDATEETRIFQKMAVSMEIDVETDIFQANTTVAVKAEKLEEYENPNESEETDLIVLEQYLVGKVETDNKVQDTNVAVMAEQLEELKKPNESEKTDLKVSEEYIVETARVNDTNVAIMVEQLEEHEKRDESKETDHKVSEKYLVENMETDRVQDINVALMVEQIEELKKLDESDKIDLKISEEKVETDRVRQLMIPQREEHEKPDVSEEADLKVSGEYLVEKVTDLEEVKTEHNKRLPQDENSNDTLNSSMSTAAHKDSGEASESNTEMNLNRNSLNINTEMEYKMIQNFNFNERSETITELKESAYAEPQIAIEEQQNIAENVQDKSCTEKSESPEQKIAVEVKYKAQEEENKGRDENEGENENKELESRANEKENQVTEMQQSENTDISNNHKILEKPKDIENENQELDASNCNKKSEDLKDVENNDDSPKADTEQFESNSASNYNKIPKESKDIDNENEIKEIENKQVEHYDASNTAEISKDIGKENENQETDTQQLEKNDEVKSRGEIAEQILVEIKEKEVCSDEKVAGVHSKDLNESENIEKGTNLEEILTNKNEALQEDMKSEENLDNEDSEQKTYASKTELIENIENIVSSKENEETEISSKTLENYTELQAVATDSIKAINPMQDPAVCEHRAQPNNDELESTESSLALDYFSSDELNKTSQIIDQAQLEPAEYKKATDAITVKEKTFATIDEKKSETTDCAKEAVTTPAQVKLDVSEFKKETDATTDQENPPTSVCKTAGDCCSSDQTKLEASVYYHLHSASHSPLLTFDDTSSGSMKSKADDVYSDSETQHLKTLCLTRNVKVLVCKLRPEDLRDLRQPKVKIQRTSYEKYRENFRAKRRCIEGRSYIEFEDSSSSNISFATNTSSSEAYHPTRVKRKIPIRRQSLRQTRTSESENDTNNSDDFKLSTIIANSRKRRLSTSAASQSSTSKHVTGPKSARKTVRKSTRHVAGPKSSKQHLVVTPRSASGLKLRISNAEQNFVETGPLSKRSRRGAYNEVIQLSSSSDECPLDDLSTIEEVIELEEYPLFEEEIVI